MRNGEGSLAVEARLQSDDAADGVRAIPGMDVVRIPLKLIRPFKDQPRKHFNHEGLLALGESIKAVGQKRPVWVRRIDEPPYRFELIDGERRYRACELCGIPAVLACVMDVSPGNEQFLVSVVGNFGSEPHTPLEITFALQRMRDAFVDEGMESAEAVEKVARVVAHSDAWVYQYLGFLRLCPAVQGLMEEKKLSFQVCVALTNVTPDAQVKMASCIVQRGLSSQEALRYVRLHRTPDVLTETARPRHPADDFEIVERFFRRLDQNVEAILDMNEHQVRRMFESRPRSDLEAIIKRARGIEDGMRMLREVMEGVLVAGER